MKNRSFCGMGGVNSVTFLAYFEMPSFCGTCKTAKEPAFLAEGLPRMSQK